LEDVSAREIAAASATQATLVLNSLLPVAPPQLSDEELRQLEAEASFSLRQSLVIAVALYFCKYRAAPSLSSC